MKTETHGDCIATRRVLKRGKEGTSAAPHLGVYGKEEGEADREQLLV